MGRRKNRKLAAQNGTGDTSTIGTHVADESSDAVREFASTTGAAAREFATVAFNAAKDLLETVDAAGSRLEKQSKPKRRRGRKLLKLAVLVGVGVAIATNDSVRSAISETLGLGDSAPDPWDVGTASGDGAAAPAAQSAG